MLESRLTSDPLDLEAMASHVAWAFGDERKSSLDWLERAEPGSLRVVGRGGKVEGGLLEVPMGQWFQGRSVSTLGVAGVAIAPEARGRGLALALMSATLHAARERGLALSTLYPSTYGLYRKVGYELAGSRCRFTLQLRHLSRSSRALPVHGLGAGDVPAIDALYGEIARARTGYLDRGNYIWNRVRSPRGGPARGFGVQDETGLVGYLYARSVAPRQMPIELSLSDFVTNGPLAFRALLGFLADHLTTAERVSWQGGIADARLLGLPDRVVSATVEDYWMLRLVHVERALLERGYPMLDAAIDLQVDDALLPANTGTYGLRVSGGVAQLAAPGQAARARLSVGALASLFSGFLGPRELTFAGELEADERALATLGAIFAGPAPACADYF